MPSLVGCLPARLSLSLSLSLSLFSLSLCLCLCLCLSFYSGVMNYKKIRQLADTQRPTLFVALLAVAEDGEVLLVGEVEEADEAVGDRDVGALRHVELADRVAAHAEYVIGLFSPSISPSLVT